LVVEPFYLSSLDPFPHVQDIHVQDNQAIFIMFLLLLYFLSFMKWVFQHWQYILIQHCLILPYLLSSEVSQLLSYRKMKYFQWTNLSTSSYFSLESNEP
jgi:hypothetical protein